MRLLSILLFLVTSLIAFGQKPLATTVSNPDYMVPFQDRLDRESFPFTASMSPTGATGSSSTLLLSTYTVIRPGVQVFNGPASQSNATANSVATIRPSANRVYYIPVMTVSFSSTATALTSLTLTATTTLTTATYIVPNGGSVVIPNVKINASDVFNLFMPGTAVDSRAITVTVDCGAAYDLTADDRPSRKYVSRRVGDSITYGTGPVYTSDTWTDAMNKYWDGRGYPTREVNFGEPGKTSTQIAYRVKTEFYKYDYDNVKFQTLMIGTNNANLGGGTISAAQLTAFDADVTLFLNERWRYAPNSLLIVLGPPPAGSPTYDFIESNLVPIRQHLRTLVINWKAAHTGDSRIVFIDLGGSTTEWPTAVFDKTQTANYLDWLHPSPTGSAAIAARITAYLTANPTLLPVY